MVTVAKQQHDLGVKKRKLNKVLNLEPLSRADRVAKRKYERLMGRDDGTEKAQRMRLKKVGTNRKAKDW